MTKDFREGQEVGEVMHLAKSTRLIVRLLGSAGKETRPGEILVDQRGRGVGKVLEIIGPVASPYASVIPLIDRANKVLGMKLYRARSLRSQHQR
ncbi:MAG TPA: Gar1/Naf1 family protein [Candidatus Nitrosopolaris sp.]|nr:Gar1/Naf1 family protein [Candidatus Nitrosopolaris sp.]